MDKLSAVAVYILQKLGPMSTMKLQKLMYYCQCWSLVWDDRPMFDNRIEAWVNGPVIVDLYNLHKGHFLVSADFFKDKKCTELDEAAIETIEAVLDFYGHRNPQELSLMTHYEEPWKNARIGLGTLERGNNEITLESMAEYYGSLQ